MITRRDLLKGGSGLALAGILPVPLVGHSLKPPKIWQPRSYHLVYPWDDMVIQKGFATFRFDNERDIYEFDKGIADALGLFMWKPRRPAKDQLFVDFDGDVYDLSGHFRVKSRAWSLTGTELQMTTRIEFSNDNGIYPCLNTKGVY